MGKPLVWLRTEIRSPPVFLQARLELGVLLRRLQHGETLTMPQARPMPQIGIRCQELRVSDGNSSWRLIYRVDPDAILILTVFMKKARTTPRRQIEACKRRIRSYEACRRDSETERP